MTSMRAVIQRKYGTADVLEVADVEIPVPGVGEVLLRVRAASLNPLDWHSITGTPYIMRPQTGLRCPKQSIPGTDVAGVVEAVGAGVVDFVIGDEVFGYATGSFAEFVCVKSTALVRRPATMGFVEAAAVPVAALTALQALRDKAQIGAGHHVLINGAAGGVGTFAVQIAKALGADVTGVCSGRNVDLVRSLGADQVVDYAIDDFVAGGHQYDVVIDMIGNRSPRELRRALVRGGKLVIVGGPDGGRLLGPMRSMLTAVVRFALVREKAVPFLARLNGADLAVLAELATSGKLMSVIDSTFPLAEAAAAVRHLAGGHARGKIVLEA